MERKTSDDMDHFICYTLVDITDTRVSDPARALPYQQFQNLNTLIQCVGLRAQPFAIEIERRPQQNLSEYDFGTEYEGQHDVWVLSWSIEKSGYVSVENLTLDSEGLPIHTRLEETVCLPTQMLEPKDAARLNTYFVHARARDTQTRPKAK